MGVINQGVLGGVSGTIGPLIGSSWKGIPYLRIKPLTFNDPKKPKQLDQRLRFKGCSLFAKTLLFDVIHPIWNMKAIGMSGYDLFIKKNHSAFDEMGRIGNYEMLKISIGELMLPDRISIHDSNEATGEMQLVWDNSPGTYNASAGDWLRILVIINGEAAIVDELIAPRGTGTAILQLGYLPTDEVHIYLYFQNSDGTSYSDSKHLPVNIPPATPLK